MRATVLALCALALLVGLVGGEQSMTVTATAYNSTPAQTSGNPNEGAGSDEIRPGMKVLAVSPDLIESGLNRGTKVRIDGVDGVWTALDRTASRFSNRIDLYMGTDVDAAVTWGIKEVTIFWNPAH